MCKYAAHQVIPSPVKRHTVDVTFKSVTVPLAAMLRDPVEACQRSVSVVIANVITPAPLPFCMPITVPMGKATVPFAGIVKVRAVVSASGW